ncbi:MAG TPA: XkdX family protein [Candidatus Nitrosocosmicus sp.]|nr:XkdX family protein [Candidatus Nitrosocosmicus sp.]
MSDVAVKWKMRYANGWATVEQLKRLVGIGVITQAEYDQIVT